MIEGTWETLNQEPLSEDNWHGAQRVQGWGLRSYLEICSHVEENCCLKDQKGSSSGSLRSEKEKSGRRKTCPKQELDLLNQSFLLLNGESLMHQASLWILYYTVKYKLYT